MRSIFKHIVVSILIWESKLIIRKYRPFVVAVTGSVGKTSTKDAIYDVLKGDVGFVRKSEKGFNSEIGLPLTVIGVPNGWYDAGIWFRNIGEGLRLILQKRDYPKMLILEIGADHPGDIRRVTRWLHPDISVITRVSRTPVHVEFFKSPEEVFEEKSALATAVKDGGTLVVFGDDERTLSMGERVKGRNVSVVSYGMKEGAAVRGSEVAPACGSEGPTGMSLRVTSPAGTGQISIRGVIGDGAVYSVLAAAAVGYARMPERFTGTVIPALERIEFPKGRMNIIPGMNSSTIIDDTYNSSPDAASAALAVLKSLPCSDTKIAALGDMMELGKYSAQEHRRIGIEAAQSANLLVTVGQRSRATAEEAMKSGMPADAVKAFDSSKEAAAYLASIVKQGDVVLVKGSQSIRMERVSAALLREPEKAATLLVRQEKEWLAKH